MGYIYEAMDRAKVAIQSAFKGNEDKYKELFAIINARWDGQLHHRLHGAWHLLNLEFFYKNSKMKNDRNALRSSLCGLYKCIEKLIGSIEMEDKILSELVVYKRVEGMFGLNIAKKVNDYIVS